MRIEESLFQKVNIGSTHPHDFIVTIIGTHLKLGEISLRLFGKMEEGCTPKTTLPLANIYNTQELDTRRICLPLNGTGHTWHHNQEYLFNVTRYGFKKMDPNYSGKMMGNEDLTDDEIWSILAYVKFIWPDSIKEKYNSMYKN